MFQTVFVILQSHKWRSCLWFKFNPSPNNTNTQRRGSRKQIFILNSRPETDNQNKHYSDTRYKF